MAVTPFNPPFQKTHAKRKLYGSIFRSMFYRPGDRWKFYIAEIKTVTALSTYMYFSTIMLQRAFVLYVSLVTLGKLAHDYLNTLIFYSATRFTSSPCHSFTNQDRARNQNRVPFQDRVRSSVPDLLINSDQKTKIRSVWPSLLGLLVMCCQLSASAHGLLVMQLNSWGGCSC